MTLKISQIDAFTDRPFSGNPAAVCVLSEEMDDAWMQHLATEMNLSETAFLLAKDDGWHLRWFTPTAEVDLCGHATLASAHHLWESGLIGLTTQARFVTRSGRLSATRRGALIELDFPSEPATPCPPPAGLCEALGASVTWSGRNRLDQIVLLGSENELHELAPDFRALQAIDIRGAIVTAKATSGMFDFVSRYFAPAFGIDEDPVTGSAHCCLGPFWQERLNKDSMLGYQASPRGGTVHVTVRGGRVTLGGQAVTVMRGELSEHALPAVNS